MSNVAKPVNDSNEGKKQSAFFMVVHPSSSSRGRVDGRMPEMRPITSLCLELGLGAVSCSECHLLMQLGEDDMTALRERL